MPLQTIIDWNETMLDAIRAAKTPPPVAAKAMAATQTAVFDAINAITGSQYEGYNTRTTASSSTSQDAAAISASYNVLKALFPSFGTTLDSRYSAALSTLNGQAGVSEGIDLGKLTATNILENRSADGSTKTVTYTPVEGLGFWEPTPPAYAAGLLPQWPGVRPWAMLSGNQFRPDGPPDLTDGKYTSDFNQVKNLGELNSTSRTANQTEIANFWADGGGTATPPGHWQEIAQTLAQTQNLSMIEAAKMFALLSITVADAGIVAWDAKYTYQNWRPETAIAHADEDGNPNTASQSGWKPLLASPPFPDYVSGHSTFSASSAAILADYFGKDNFSFGTTSDGLPGVTRNFTSLTKAAEEAGISRIYGGIHFQFANEDGQAAGKELAQYVGDYFLLKQHLLTTGNDVVTATVNESTRALAGNDSVMGSGGIDRIYGGLGGDTIKGGAEADQIFGGDALSDSADGNDSIWGGTGADTILGNAGNDTIYGESTSNDSTDGSDYIHGGAGFDLIFGNAGNDTIIGSSQADTIDGGEGNDLLIGGNAKADATLENDMISGGLGSDTIYGNAGNDTIYGGSGTADSTDGADMIYGGLGDDLIYGNGGIDSIAGATGNDVMYGGAGNDIFLIGNNNGRDLIGDFQGAGSANGDVLHILSHINGTSYDSAATIMLLVDVQGNDAIIWFNPSNNVTISGGAALNASDIVIVNSDSF